MTTHSSSTEVTATQYSLQRSNMGHQPGDLFKAHQSGKSVGGMMKRMKSALPSQKIFQGKKSKVAEPSKDEIGAVFKKKRKASKNDHDVDDKGKAKKKSKR